jgi:undecaprenyl-phosphate 4-deoxy-4-formamido-L-arabinose transferase
VVIPCYKSSDTLEPLVERIHASLEARGVDYEVVLVVDGSPDDTWDVVRRLAKDDRVRGIELMRNYGQHNALLAGIQSAEHDLIVTMDDDLQHPPEQIPRLLDALGDDIDLVYGVAKVEEHGFWRNLASRAVKSAMAITLGVDHARQISAFRAFRSDLRSPFLNVEDAFVSIDVILSWVTTRIASIEVEMERRAEAESNYNVRSLFRHALNMVTGYSITPLKLVTMLGLVTALVGFLALVVVLVLYFTGSTEVAGFTTLASMVALFAGAQMAAIGILGEYLGRLHFRSMHRPTFVIRDEIE